LVAEEFGISKGGQDAEDRFIILTGATPAESALGDAVVDGQLVEIKRVKTTTINQVRPIKYLPLVLYNWTQDRWFVIPAHRLVVDAAKKRRGQHTEIAFESVNFTLTAYAEHEVAADDLREAVLAAAAESDGYPKLKQAMQDLLARLQASAEENRVAVAALLEEYGLS
jgi:hypothetical protein